MSYPARALSKAEAFAELQTLVDEGTLLFEGYSDEHHVNLDGLNPYTGEKEAGNVAGVVIRYGEAAAAPDHLDPRNALGLVRLCQYLSSEFGVTDLFHLGISGDASGGRTDCHGQGRAVDFAGAARRVGDDTDFQLTVLDDWGTAYTGYTPDGDWPGDTGSAVTYRLGGEGTFAETFFAGVYEFVAGQWQDRSVNPDGEDTPTSIGEGSFVMSPDHPTSAPGTAHGREAHKNHLHMQIGKTGHE